MLVIHQFRDRRTNPAQWLRGFTVTNRKSKVLALGAFGPGHAFVVMHAKRYEHDLDLCRKIRKLTGIAPRDVIL
jgi:hypothetical protein